MEDIFLLPKAKAPVIFKTKTASALEFHIQFLGKKQETFSDMLPLWETVKKQTVIMKGAYHSDLLLSKAVKI